MRRRVSRFLSEHAGQGYESVSLHGGEATIRRDFLEILDEIREKGYPTVHLMTNARKLARMEFARHVVGQGREPVRGVDARCHRPDPGQISKSLGSFDQAVAGIRTVKELGATVRTNSVVCQGQLHRAAGHRSTSARPRSPTMSTSRPCHTSGTALRNFLGRSRRGTRRSSRTSSKRESGPCAATRSC